MNRRNFLQNSLMSTAAFAASTPAFSKTKDRANEFAIFTKPFQHLNYNDFADLMAEIGVDGVELPVRPKGHIEPAAAEEEIHKMVEELKKRNIKISLLASGINSVDSSAAETTLKAAVTAGIPQYRMSYFKYDLKRAIQPQLDDIKAKMKDLADMNKDIGIQAIYQNHSGAQYFGAPLWDLHTCLKGIDKKYIAAAFDVGHATVESGRAWGIQQKLLEDKTAAIFVKDYLWQGKTLKKVPLGSGMVNRKFFDNVKKSGFVGTYSLHVEYFDTKDPKALPAFRDAFKKDLAILKGLVG